MSDDTTAAPATQENAPTPAWLARARLELKELRDRIFKLESCINEVSKIDFQTLSLMKSQLSAMIAYEVALSNRIENKNQ